MLPLNGCECGKTSGTNNKRTIYVSHEQTVRMRFNKRRTTHIVIVFCVYGIECTFTFRKWIYATTTEFIRYIYRSCVFIAGWNAHIHSHTQHVSCCVPLRDVCSYRFTIQSTSLVFFSLLRMKFEIQTRIQNALLLLEFGCMRRCDVAGFWIFRRISCCQLLETSGNISIDK